MARRIAVNIAKLPKLLRQPQALRHNCVPHRRGPQAAKRGDRRARSPRLRAIPNAPSELVAPIAPAARDPGVMKLSTLADVRALMRHLPRATRERDTWRHVAEAARGGDVNDAVVALRLVLMLERVETHRFPTALGRRGTSGLLRVVRDRGGQQLAYVYFEDEPGRRSAAKLLSKDEAQRHGIDRTHLNQILNRKKQINRADPAGPRPPKCACSCRRLRMVHLTESSHPGHSAPARRAVLLRCGCPQT